MAQTIINNSRDARDRAGLNHNYHFHDLRHSGATDMAEAGGKEPERLDEALATARKAVGQRMKAAG